MRYAIVAGTTPICRRGGGGLQDIRNRGVQQIKRESMTRAKLELALKYKVLAHAWQTYNQVRKEPTNQPQNRSNTSAPRASSTWDVPTVD